MRGEKLFKWGIRGIDGISVIFFLLITVCILFDNKSSNLYSVSGQLLAVCVTLAILLIVAAALKKWEKRISAYVDKNYRRILTIVFLLLAAIQVYLVTALSAPIGWDVKAVVGVAAGLDYAQTSYYQQYYFSAYPNNMLLLVLVRNIVNIFGREQIWLILSFLNILAIDSAILMIFFVVRRCLGNTYGLAGVAFSIALYGLFGWMIVPYSDTLVMPFITGAWLVFQKIREEDSPQKKYGWMALSALLVFAGYLVKPTAVILWIAYVIIQVLYLFRQKKRLHLLLYLLIFGVCFWGLNAGWSAYKQRQNVLPVYYSNVSVPMTHFIMMGLNQETYGAYLTEDALYTESFLTTQDKMEANMPVIRQRLGQMLSEGTYLNFLYNKLNRVYCEGDFFWGKEGNFASFDYENGHTFIKSIYYPEGSRHGIYLYVTQGIWVAALLLATGGWNSKMREDCTLAHLTIIGITLFLLIFEMRSRYLIPFLPIFSAAAVFGLEGYVTMKEIRRKTL